MTPLVLIPGLMCDARLFAPTIAAFSPSHDLVLANITEHDTMQTLASEFLKTAPPTFALCGLSMGGIVAMEIVRQAPHRVARLALLDTNPRAESPEMQQQRTAQMQAVKDGRLTEIMREELKPRYLAESEKRQDLLTLCMDMAHNLGSQIFLRQSQALMTRPDQTETLRNADTPALILCGREDALCPVSRHEMMASLLANATLEIIDGAGHLPTLEQPDKTNAALARWLEVTPR